MIHRGRAADVRGNGRLEKQAEEERATVARSHDWELEEDAVKNQADFINKGHVPRGIQPARCSDCLVTV